jgi:hypothetical protein
MPLAFFRNRSALTRARAGIVIAGVLLPYLARIPGTFVHGSQWLEMHLFGGLGSFMLIQLPNALCWGTLFALSFTLRKVSTLILPSVAYFGLLAYLHAGDLSGFKGFALLYLPIVGIPVVLVTFFVSVILLGTRPRPF